jgi:hypothetical protein
MVMYVISIYADYQKSSSKYKIRIFIRPDSEFIRESVCACAKLIVDEEAHGSLNRIVELNKTLTDSIRIKGKL